MGVAYGSDTALVQRTLFAVVEANPLVLKVPAPAVFFLECGDSALQFEIRVFVRDLTERFPLIHELHMAIERALWENHITIPFPQRDIHIFTTEAPLTSTSP
jgi:potassium efflux system protein